MDGPDFDALTRRLALATSRRTALKGFVGGVGALIASRGAESQAAQQARVNICHRTGNGSYSQVSVNANALSAHEAHGDGLLGSEGHCGACGNTCDPGFRCCDNECIDVRRDPDNCGACGTVCESGECFRSWCYCGEVPCGCEQGEICDGACIDVTSDPDHCGNCGWVCESGECTDGECLCEGGLAWCNGECVDTGTNPAHCGSCYSPCSNDLCEDGVCVCPEGETLCPDLGCANLQTDPYHCGECWFDCGPGTCEAGTCVCNAGTTLCEFGCVDTSNDRSNCGACGNFCEGFGRECLDSACVCPWHSPDYCFDAYCTDLRSDPSNCGSCGNTCPFGCMNGLCTCAEGWTLCNGECVENGCVCEDGLTYCGGFCVDISSNPSNCGNCGIACPAGESCIAGGCSCGGGSTCGFGESCIGGQCGCGGGPVCASGSECCGGQCLTPDDYLTDPFNCGGCGIDCDSQFPYSVCVNGFCQCDVDAHACGGACFQNDDPSHCELCRPCEEGQICQNLTCVWP